MSPRLRTIAQVPHHLFQSSSDHTLHELFALYKTDILNTKAKSTQINLGWVLSWLDVELGAMPLRDVTPDFLRAWRDKLAKVYAPGTVHGYMIALSGPLTAAVRDYEWLTENPMTKVRKPPISPNRGRFLLPEERVRLLAACQASPCKSLYTIAVLALATGARKTELMTLTWERVDLGKGVLRFPLTKNGDPRRVPLCGLALKLMMAHHAAHTPGIPMCFPGLRPGRPLHMDKAWRKAVKVAGIGSFRFHDLRHTAASALAMSGASLLEIAEVLGHRTMDMVKRYSHFTDGHIGGVVERMTEQFLPEG